MSIQETRILPLTHSVSAEYAIVSMPSTAWYWLDDLVSQYYPYGGYDALLRGMPTKCPAELASSLGSRAQQYCQDQMKDLYGLANDNENLFPLKVKRTPAHPSTPEYNTRMPSVYQLFCFMPHATYLTTVWERRNYHLRGDFL